MSSYVPQLTAYSPDNVYTSPYYTGIAGGYAPPMPNCTRYAYGRWWALMGSQPSGLANLGNGHAARAIGNEATVAHGSDVGVEQRAHHKAGSQLDVHSSRGGINHGADAECQFGTLLVGPFHQLAKHLLGKVTAIGKLESADATLIASFHHVLAGLKILIVKHGNHARIADLLQYGYLIKLCHFLLTLYATVGIATSQ